MLVVAAGNVMSIKMNFCGQPASGGIKPSMKVAIYTSVSGKSNRQDAANQSLHLIEYCQRQGWDYVEYTDRMSGTGRIVLSFCGCSRMPA